MFGKNRQNRKNVITLTISLIILFCVNNLVLTLSNYVQHDMLSAVEFRMVKANIPRNEEARQKFIDFIEEKSCVECWADDAFSLAFSFKEKEENEEKIEIILDECLYETIRPYLMPADCPRPQGNEVILAKYITNYDPADMVKNEYDETYDGEQFLGQTIKGNVKYIDAYGERRDEDYELKVIGVYDNLALGMEWDAMMDPQTIDGLQGVGSEEIDPEDIRELSYRFTIIVNNAEEVAPLVKEIQYYIDRNDQINMWEAYPGFVMFDTVKWFFWAVTLISNTIAIFLLINTIINIAYATEQDILADRQRLGLMKAVGYRELTINLSLAGTIIKRTVIAFLITLVLGVALNAGGTLLLRQYLNLYNQNFRFRIYGISLLLMILASLAAQAAAFISCALGLHKLEIVEALKDKE